MLGTRRAYIFDPYGRAWIRIEDMRRGRWYPTNITLPAGKVITMSGVNDADGALNPDIELWDPNGVSNWELLGQETMSDYPYVHVLTSGLVFRSGPEPETMTFDPSTGVWTAVDVTNFPGRYEAPSVLLPPFPDRVMIIGGFAKMGQPTHSAEIIDLTVGSPAWQPGAPMTYSRMAHDAVLLPDGKVLVVGGQANSESSPDSVMIPEIYDPAANAWDVLAPHQVARMYHSTTLLLPDGRVLAAGGDQHPSGEIYSPPYLFGGPRPTITQAPAAVAYGTTFSLQFNSSTTVNTVVLVRLSSVTHSVNMGQRYVRLAEAAAAGTAPIVAPADGNVAPPGFYMLFVVDDDGVPSISRVVRIITRFGDFDQDGDVDASDYDAFAGCFTGPGNGPVAPTCEPGDFDDDQDIDCDDWEAFVSAWTEPGEPPSLPQCDVTAVEDGTPSIVDGRQLSFQAVSPNPFRASTSLHYTLLMGSHVRLTIEDVRGRRVAVLIDESQAAGAHAATWSGKLAGGGQASRGVYFARLVAGGETRVRAIVLNR